ncbi:hypothetical protein N658DRAFT_141406 [Parathielavia hyrcaniae]|uniref:Uncharacterized protein n=1 Tax=Parathielavia hyrcaniae TaxID=113614 RepID=A0AAN6PYI7_9PEZI|nr:hypothetical protein N658DRAFT_141406 [Parathielavia hyrcaniae]
MPLLVAPTRCHEGDVPGVPGLDRCRSCFQLASGGKLRVVQRRAGWAWDGFEDGVGGTSTNRAGRHPTNGVNRSESACGCLDKERLRESCRNRDSFARSGATVRPPVGTGAAALDLECRVSWGIAGAELQEIRPGCWGMRSQTLYKTPASVASNENLELKGAEDNKQSEWEPRAPSGRHVETRHTNPISGCGFFPRSAVRVGRPPSSLPSRAVWSACWEDKLRNTDLDETLSPPPRSRSRNCGVTVEAGTWRLKIDRGRCIIALRGGSRLCKAWLPGGAFPVWSR